MMNPEIEFHSPLFKGIQSDELEMMLRCIGYHIGTCEKGSIISFEQEEIRQIGIILSGVVEMIKEDFWGNKTVLVRMEKGEMFGETFACGADSRSIVSFAVSEKAKILFLSFHKVMNTCTMTCKFHHRLVENMVEIIAKKNRELMYKIDILSKKTLREKIMAYLSLQAQSTDSGYFEIPLGRVEMAEYICADRSALTRELTKMKKEGLIDFEKNCFRIL